MTADRLSLLGDAPTETLTDFGTDVARGLSRPLKRISCRWFYDEAGSQLFEEICDLDEYYPTRAEDEILREHADEIVGRMAADAVCVELGSGSSIKTRRLLDAFLRSRARLEYVPIDISPTALESSARELLKDYDDLTVTGIVGEYRRGFEWMSENADRPKLVLWLGSNLGNFDRDGATEFVREIRAHMTERDRLLLGVDLRKDRETLEAAYDDPGGVTARFNLNVLSRINRELGGDLDLDGFAHEAVYEEDEGRVVMNLVSLRAQKARLEALDMDVTFHSDERIHTEDSYKYAPEEIDALAESAGFTVEDRWTDAAGRFSVNLLRARATDRH